MCNSNRESNPPQGYVCHRCKHPGHFIQHCPTNGDPNYDIKILKNSTGIPKHMLQVDPNGSYVMPGGVVAVVRPDEAAFDKLFQDLPSSSSSPPRNLPPELHCPICKQVMKDAVLTSKCCVDTFCDRCIRSHIISKLSCICGATNILADHLLPNITVRKTIDSMLQSHSSSSGSVKSCVTTEYQESGTTNNEPQVQPSKQLPDHLKEATSNEQPAEISSKEQTLEKPNTLKAEDLLTVTLPEEIPTSQESLQAQQEAPHSLPTSGPGMKEKKNNDLLPVDTTEQHYGNSQISPTENYCNGYWGGMTGINTYLAPPYGPVVPYLGYPHVPFGFTHGAAFPQYHNVSQGYWTSPTLPQKSPGVCVGKKHNESHKTVAEKKYDSRKTDPEQNESRRRPSSQQQNESRRSANKEEGNRGDSSGRERKHLMMEASSDNEEERHFKKRPPRYEPQEVDCEEDGRERRSLRESARYEDLDREHHRDYKRQRQYWHCRR